MGRALRSLLAFAGLLLWLNTAAAFCVSEVAYEYVMRGDEPAPERSLPCCAVSNPVAVSAQKDRPLDGRVAAALRTATAAFDAIEPLRIGPIDSPLRWRAYCERSCRLLR